MGLIDSQAGTLTLGVIDYVHRKTVNGASFTASHNVSVGTATAVSMLILTPATAVGIVHASPTVESDKAVSWTFSEAPNASGGSAVVSYNNSRSSSTTAGTTITHTATYVSAGTVFETHFINTAGGASSISSGDDNVHNEYLLRPSTLYLVRVVAAAAATNVAVNMRYYLD